MIDLTKLQNTYRQRIKEIREANQETQEQLANALNVSVDTISKMEQGKCKITVDNIVAIAEHYNVNLDWICGRTDELKDPCSILETLLKFINIKNCTMTSGENKYSFSKLSIHTSLLKFFKDTAIATKTIENLPKEHKEALLQQCKENFCTKTKEDEFKRNDSLEYALVDFFKSSEELLQLLNNNFIIK